jgi:hypothetical protein
VADRLAEVEESGSAEVDRSRSADNVDKLQEAAMRVEEDVSQNDVKDVKDKNDRKTYGNSFRKFNYVSGAEVDADDGFHDDFHPQPNSGSIGSLTARIGRLEHHRKKSLKSLTKADGDSNTSPDGSDSMSEPPIEESTSNPNVIIQF